MVFLVFCGSQGCGSLTAVSLSYIIVFLGLANEFLHPLLFFCLVSRLDSDIILYFLRSLVAFWATFPFFFKHLNGGINGIHHADDMILQHEQDVGILGVLVLDFAQQR